MIYARQLTVVRCIPVPFYVLDSNALFMKSEFLRPHLVGPRFDEHTIPIEVLKDWAAFESLVVETAKWLYLEENSGRQRVPRGFESGFTLHLSGVDEGCAVPVLERIHPQGSLLPDIYAQWFDRARDRIVEVIAAAGSGASIDRLLPKHLLAYFDQFGRSLREDEQIEFQQLPQSPPVIYSKATRKNLVLRTASEYRSEEGLRGSIIELNAKTHTFTFELIGGAKVSGPYGEAVANTAHDALKEYENSGAFALVRAVVVRDQSDGLKKIESVSHIEVLDALDVSARIDQLLLLRDGWHDGEGLAPAHDGLRWFTGAWESHWPSDAPLPCVFPTPEGGIQAEWVIASLSISAEIDLTKKRAALLAVNTQSGDIVTDETFDLASDAGWKAIAQRVQPVKAA